MNKSSNFSKFSYVQLKLECTKRGIEGARSKTSMIKKLNECCVENDLKGNARKGMKLSRFGRTKKDPITVNLEENDDDSRDNNWHKANQSNIHIVNEDMFLSRSNKQMLMRLQTPIWIFDLTKRCMLWGNIAAVDLWGKDTLDQLLEVDPYMPENRIQEYIRTFQRGATLTENYVFKSSSRKPVSVICACSGVYVESAISTSQIKNSVNNQKANTRICMLVEAKIVSGDHQPLSNAPKQTIQIWEHLHTSVALFGTDFRKPTKQNDFASKKFELNQLFKERFVEESVANQIIEDIARKGFFEGEVEMNCPKIQCTEWHQIEVMRLFDSNAGNYFIVMRGNSIANHRKDLKTLENTQLELKVCREKELDAGNQKAQFLAVLSHELRTPINGVVGMTGMLTDTVLNEKQKDYVDTCRLCCRFLLSILDDITNLQRFEGKKDGEESTDQVTHAPFSIISILKDAVYVVSPKAKEKHLDIEVKVDLEHAFYIANGPSLTQALVSLIINSIKFSDPGKLIKVSVSKYHEPNRPSNSQNKECILFVVEDFGLGIAEEYQDKIFEEFFQVDKTSTRAQGGTGIGLAIAKRCVEAANGSIWCNSKLGEGSKFYFTFYVTPHNLVMSDTDTQKEYGSSTFRMTSLHHEKFSADSHSSEPDTPPENVPCIKPRTRFLSDSFIYRHAISDGPLDHSSSTSHITNTQSKLMNLAMQLNEEDDELVSDQQNRNITAAKRMSNRRSLITVVEKENLAVRPKGIKPEKRKKKKKKKGKKKRLLATSLPLKIMVVDDVPINLKVATMFFKKMGYRNIDTASDGLEAIQKERDNDYDLLLMDVEMPNCDGLEATRTIRKERAAFTPITSTPSTSTVPRPVIIAVTARALPGDEKICLDAGMNAYMTKPMAFESLQKCVSVWGPLVSPPPTIPSATPTPSPRSPAASTRSPRASAQSPGTPQSPGESPRSSLSLTQQLTSNFTSTPEKIDEDVISDTSICDQPRKRTRSNSLKSNSIYFPHQPRPRSFSSNFLSASGHSAVAWLSPSGQNNQKSSRRMRYSKSADSPSSKNDTPRSLGQIRRRGSLTGSLSASQSLEKIKMK